MIKYVFATIGSGKTTYACRILKKELDKIRKGKSNYKNLFCNFHNHLVPRVDMHEFGPKVFPDYSLVVIDESGIDFNNRQFKKMLIETIEEFKLSRHRHCDMIIISQTWNDTDLAIRSLCEVYWQLFWMGSFTMGRRIIKEIKPDRESGDMKEFYRYGRLIRSILPYPFYQNNFLLFLRSPYYRWFNSYDAPEKPLMTIIETPKYYEMAFGSLRCCDRTLRRYERYLKKSKKKGRG